MAAVEVWANDGQAVVTAGGTTAPAAGTVESWTLFGSALPAVSSSAAPPTQCYIADAAPGAESEKILVTNISGTTATVTRGADGTTPVAHAAGFTAVNVVTRASLEALQAGPYFNIRNYGAALDGVTDDTAAVAAAIAAAQAAGGGTVFHPGGTALVSSSIAAGGGYPGALQFRGSGWNSEYKLANGSNCYLFDFGSSGSPQYTPGALFADIYLNCNGANQTGGVSGGVYARGAVYCVFDHVWIDQPYDAGVRFFQDGVGNYGHHNRFVNCLFTGGYASAGNGLAIRFEQADENSAVGCTFQDCGTTAGPATQVYDTNAGLQSFSACAFVTTRSTAVSMIKSDSSPSRVMISGCQFDSSTTGNQVEAAGSGVTVAASKFLNFGSTANAAVHVTGQYAIVEGCTFTPSGALGLAVSGGAGGGYAQIGLNAYEGSYAAGGPVSPGGAGGWTTPAGMLPSGDTTGAADAAAINTAVAALPAGGGTVHMTASAPWHLAAGGVSAINRSGAYLEWQPGATVACTGTGDILRMFDSSAYGSGRAVNGGGILGYPTFDISAMGTGSSAFHAGDILGLKMRLNVYNAGVPGQAGIHLDNNFYWTEQAQGDVRVTGCSVTLDNSANTSGSATGSFDRLDLKVWTLNGGMADALVFLNNAFIGDLAYLGIFGNFGYAGTATVYYVIRFSGTSYIQGPGPLLAGVELDGSGTTAPSTILFTASPYNYIQDVTGFLSFGAGSAFTPAPHNSGNFRFFGTVIGDSSLVPVGAYKPVAQTVTVTANGQTFYCNFTPLVYLGNTASRTGLIIYGGGFDGQPLVLVNTGTGTLTFAAAGTSNVAQGTAVALAPGARREFTWNATTNLWY